MEQVRIVDPEGRPARADRPVVSPAPRPATLRGLRVGLLDNGKPNAREALAAIAEALSGEHEVVGVPVTKPIASRACPEELLEQVRALDVAVVGVGD